MKLHAFGSYSIIEVHSRSGLISVPSSGRESWMSVARALQHVDGENSKTCPACSAVRLLHQRRMPWPAVRSIVNTAFSISGSLEQHGMLKAVLLRLSSRPSCVFFASLICAIWLCPYPGIVDAKARVLSGDLDCGVHFAGHRLDKTWNPSPPCSMWCVALISSARGRLAVAESNVVVNPPWALGVQRHNLTQHQRVWRTY